jgi:hypothetical protein
MTEKLKLARPAGTTPVTSPVEGLIESHAGAFERLNVGAGSPEAPNEAEYP